VVGSLKAFLITAAGWLFAVADPDIFEMDPAAIFLQGRSKTATDLAAFSVHQRPAPDLADGPWSGNLSKEE